MNMKVVMTMKLHTGCFQVQGQVIHQMLEHDMFGLGTGYFGRLSIPVPSRRVKSKKDDKTFVAVEN